MVERPQGGRAAAGRRRGGGLGSGFQFGWEREAGREEAEAGRAGKAGRAGGRAEGGEWRSGGAWAAAAGARRRGRLSAPRAARAPRCLRAPGLPPAPAPGPGPLRPPPAARAPGHRARPFSFPFYILLHYLWTEMRAWALASAAAATSPRGSPGQTQMPRRRPPPGPWRRREPGTALGVGHRLAEGAAPRADSRLGRREAGPKARTPRRGPAPPGQFPGFTFSFLPPVSQQPQVFIFWRMEKAKGRGD